MLEALVIMLREGLEAALVVGIVLAYLARTGRGDLRRYVWLGLGAAALGSLAGAAAFQWLGISPDNEIYEGTLMLTAAAFTATMVVWMWRTGRTLRADLEDQMARVLAARAHAGRAGPGLAAFVFVVVFREGIEAVLFVSALSATIGSNPVNNLIGGSAGLLLAVAFGTLLAKGAVRVNLKRFFSVTSVILMILVVKLVANGLHEFLEINLLPSTPDLLALIGLLTRETTSLTILIALIAAPALLMLWDAWRTPLPQPRADEPAPEWRKRLAGAHRARRWATAAALSGLLISGMLGSSLASAAARDAELPPAAVQPQSDAIHIPLADVNDGELHKYVYDHNGVNIRFIVLRRDDGSLAAALDACAICPAKGYYHKDGTLMCRNCDAPINANTVGEAGGCNPVPLESRIVGPDLVVMLGDLTASESKFR